MLLINVFIFSGADSYTVSTQGSYVQAPGNQGGNQGPGGLRGIPQTVVPPSSTPPNADLKVQPLPPQSTINPSQLVSYWLKKLTFHVY